MAPNDAGQLHRQLLQLGALERLADDPLGDAPGDPAPPAVATGRPSPLIFRLVLPPIGPEDVAGITAALG